MDDLLVIILTLIIAVVGALSQIKKKRQQTQPKANSLNRESNNIWNILLENQEYPVEQEEEIIEPPDIEQVISTEPEVVETPTPQYEFSAENEGESIYGSDITKKQNLGIHPMKKKLKDFSLKKAVIYSEILNRKYY